MTANNDFLSLAAGGSANVVSQMVYAGLTSLLANGYQSGIAQSNQVNKTLRQATSIAQLVGQFMQSQGQDANDDGNASALLTNFQNALRSLVGTPNVFTGGTTTGAANAQVLATVNPTTGYSLSNGFTVIFTAGFTNTGSMTLNVAATGATTVQKLSGGTLVNLAASDITTGNNFTVEYNSTAGVYVLQSSGVALGSAAFQNVAFFLQSAQNLADLPNLGTALGNLGFTSGTNWFKLPTALGGWIVQFGNVSTSGSQLISFPTTFPTSCVAVVPVGYSASSSYQTNANVCVGDSGPTTSQFRLMMGTANSGSQNSGNATYIAIGK